MAGGSGTLSMSIFLFAASAIAFVNVALMRVGRNVDITRSKSDGE